MAGARRPAARRLTAQRTRFVQITPAAEM